MVTFGENGRVDLTGQAKQRAYSQARNRPKIRRVAIATILCTLAASILVALLAGILAFVGAMVLRIVGLTPTSAGNSEGFLGGASIALMMAALNWFVFYIVLPVTLVVFSLSLGLFPSRGIGAPAVYYRWGAIWGAILVGGTTGFFGFALSAAAGFGALLTGGTIGILAGLICARLFLIIVQPARQLDEAMTAEVF